MYSNRQCDSCGSLNTSEATACYACGAPLRDLSSLSLATPVTPSESYQVPAAPPATWRYGAPYPSPAAYGAYYQYPPAYGTAGYGRWASPFYMPVAVPLLPQQETLAVWSLVLGIASLAVCLLCGIVAVILGVISLRRINAAEGALKGKGMAVAGIVMGALSTIWLAVFAFIFFQNPEWLTGA